MLKWLILFIILLVSSYYDIREKRIPNELIVIGLVVGFLFQKSLFDVFLQICVLILLFFIGMLKIMGMGDLKLWMVISCYTGFADSFIIIAVAAALLMVYAWFKNRKESVLILNHIKFSILLKERPKIIEQTAYSFAPFILLAVGLYMLWGLVF